MDDSFNNYNSCEIWRFPLSYLKKIWKDFTSVKLTVTLLLILAITSIIGTLIPQAGNPQEYVAKYGEALYRLLTVLDLFDMYHSWWFRLLIVLLALNIIICSVDRLPAVWKIVFIKKANFNPNQFTKSKAQAKFICRYSIDETKTRLDPLLRKKFPQLSTQMHDKSIYLFAEKGRWTRLGVYVVHLSVLLLLLGGLIGSIYGFDAYINIPEGEDRGHVVLRQTNEKMPLPFQIRCDDFQMSLYDTGAVKEYRSKLTILNEGRSVITKDIIVNDPLKYQGIRIFQSSYGKYPPRQFTLQLLNNKSGLVYHIDGKFDAPLSLPEGAGSIIMKDFIPSALFKGHRIGDAFYGILSLVDVDPVEIILPIKFPSFDKMRGGQWIVSIPEHEERFYTGLQVNKDPGVGVVYAGFILMIVGCFITFFTNHQKLCVQLLPIANKTTVILKGTTNRNKYGLKTKLERMAERLSRVLPR
jgi:cytochrome c biogenesis protein